MRPSGVVFEVVYPADEDQEVMTLKKNIAGMFSGHLLFEEKVSICDAFWYYQAQLGRDQNNFLLHIVEPYDILFLCHFLHVNRAFGFLQEW